MLSEGTVLAQIMQGADGRTRQFLILMFACVVSLAFLAAFAVALWLLVHNEPLPGVLQTILGFFLGGTVYGVAHTSGSQATLAGAVTGAAVSGNTPVLLSPQQARPAPGPAPTPGGAP